MAWPKLICGETNGGAAAEKRIRVVPAVEYIQLRFVAVSRRIFAYFGNVCGAVGATHLSRRALSGRNASEKVSNTWRSTPDCGGPTVAEVVTSAPPLIIFLCRSILLAKHK